MSPADLFSALSDPTRLKVLELLHDKPRPVHELAGGFDISRPAISRHLRVLKDAGLVREVKQGRENVYSLQRGEFKAGIVWLEQRERKPGRLKKQVLAEAAVPMAEPIVVPKRVVVVSIPAAEQAIAVKPKAPAKPKLGVEPPPVVPPPTKQMPQLSLFDL